MTRLFTLAHRALGAFTALLAIAVALSLFAPPFGPPQTDLVLPVRQDPPASGQFSTDRMALTTGSASQDFAPSDETRALSHLNMTWAGTVLRLWYDYTPAPDRKKMPLVILLHGAGRDGLSMIAMWQEVARANHIALVAPDALGRTWPFDQPDPRFLNQIVAEMAARHDIDPARIYLFGHSDGASYAMLLLNRTQGPWRAAALHAGYVPASRLAPPETAKPLRLYLGDHDQIFSLAGVQSATWALAQMGHAVRLTVLQDHDHWFYDTGPEIAADAWNWLNQLP